MLRNSRLLSRAFTTVAAASAVALGSLVLSAPAGAHVHVDADDPVPGGSAVITFRVPNESDSGSPTTALTVNLPDLASVSAAATPGWTTKLDRDTAAGTVRSITWTATPGGGIGADQFGLFVLQATLPDTATVSFPATQTYADGTVVKWDQAPLPGGGEPEYPAPELTLTAGDPGGEADHHAAPSAPTATATATPVAAPAPAAAAARPDNVARALAGAALLLAAVGVVAALVRRRA